MIGIAFYGVERLAADRVGDYLQRKISTASPERVVDMGWYLRKSLSLGPIRINLSKSGLGMSAGVKGLRVGTGPRGKYLHAGREGLYYRKSLNFGTRLGEDADVSEAPSAEMDPALNEVSHAPDADQLAAARWARITARAEKLRESDRVAKPGFFRSLISGIFGGLLRGR